MPSPLTDRRSDTAAVGGAVDALRMVDLSVEFAGEQGPIRAVRSVDLTVRPGELVALLGESGSGKSVTARAVLGLVGGGARVRAERIDVAGADVLTMSGPQLRSLRAETVALVMQDALSALNPVLRIGDQIGELFRVHRGLGRKEALARAVDLLGMVGIPAPRRRVQDYPHQFSGGMRQRILIAMAIALEPQLLIADEPTTALDVTVQAQILDLINSLRERLDMAVLLITHDLGVVMETADRVSVMYAGRVVETGTATEVLSRPRHPYTAALLRSVPQTSGRGSSLLTIPGTPPNPQDVPVGCSFHPRCSLADEICQVERPVLSVLAGSARTGERASACHHIDAMTTGAALDPMVDGASA